MPAASPIPMQCRGQVEGGVAQALGAALYEEMVIDDGRPRHQSEIPRLPPAVLRRRSAHRSVLRRHLRHARTDGREVDERKPLQSGRRRARQRDRRRHRHPLHRAAVQAGPAVSGAARQVADTGRHNGRTAACRPDASWSTASPAALPQPCLSSQFDRPRRSRSIVLLFILGLIANSPPASSPMSRCCSASSPARCVAAALGVMHFDKVATAPESPSSSPSASACRTSIWCRLSP